MPIFYTAPSAKAFFLFFFSWMTLLLLISLPASTGTLLQNFAVFVKFAVLVGALSKSSRLSQNFAVFVIFVAEFNPGHISKFEEWSLTREFLKQHLTEKQNSYLQSGRFREVVAYEKWSLGAS